MMTKKQKYLLWLFGAMFIIPEILWSPVMNFIYSIFAKPVNGSVVILRDNALFSYKYDSLLWVVVLTQFIGASLFLFNWFKQKDSVKNVFFFWFLLLVSALACLVSLFILYMMFALRDIGF